MPNEITENIVIKIYKIAGILSKFLNLQFSLCT